MATALPKLAAPARRALESIHVHVLEDLKQLTREEVLALHGIGNNAINQLTEAMKQQKIRFRA